MKFTRRTFLKGSAATAGLAALSAWAQNRILQKAVPEAKAIATEGGEKYINSTCRQCPARCGIRVRVVNGKAVKIEQNPLAPINNYLEGPYAGIGGLCPKGVAGLDFLYDPHRIKGPMKRTNPQKGIDVDPKFVPVTWEEALNDIAERLKKLRAEGKAKTVVAMYGRGMGPADAGILKVFMQLYGSPHVIGHSTICADGSKVAKYYMDGIKAYSIYDYDNTNYLLVFGANILESFRPLTMVLRHYGYLRTGARPKAKIVYFDVRPSITGLKADEFYIVRPGSDAAIALAMAHTILTEGLWNKKFVGDFIDGENRFKTGATVDPNTFKENWTHGLVEWWNLVLKDFTPEKAEKISGVSASDIRRIAREFALNQPGIALFERGATCYTHGTYYGMCIHALNGLVGSIYSKGGISGIQAKPPFGSFPVKVEDYMDEIALQAWEIKKEIDPKTKKEKVEIKPKEKYARYQDVADAHLNGKPYKMSVLITWMTNPCYSPANPQRFWEALKDVFVITTTPWIDDTSLFADYILPDPSYLESLLACPIYPALGGTACANLMQPVVPPLHDTRPLFWILSELAKRIGGKLGEYFTKLGSLEDVMSALIKGKKEVDPETGKEKYKIGWTLEQWKEKGVWYKKGPLIPYIHKDGKFWDVKENREMTPEEVKEKVFKTPSGKFEFRSGNKEKKLKEKIEKKLIKEGITDPKVIEAKQKEEIAKKEIMLFPHYKEPEWVGGEGFDLYLSASAKSIHHAEGRSANSPILQESFDILHNKAQGTYCWMHPKVAEARGIKDGDEVIVESPIGKIKVKALIDPRCHPEVVVIPFGHGHLSYGGELAKVGANPNLLIKNLSDPDSGLNAFNQTKVKVYKA